MSRLIYGFIFIISLFLSPFVLANTYVADISFVTSQTVYTINESIELRGNLYFSNYTDNNDTATNHTALENATVNISIINKNTNATWASYNLNTTTVGAFYSKSNFYPSAVLINVSAAGSYYIKANYTDPLGTSWWTQSEIQIVNQSIDRLEVSSDKVAYSTGESMTILVEAVSQIGDRITYIANVSVNGSIRNSTKGILSSFNCITGSNGKCSVSANASDSYGDYFVEINNFKAFSSFEVVRFEANIAMKDELGKSVKYVFGTGDQASVEITILTNSTSENYTFTGTVKSSSNTVVKNITSTTLNYNNSYSNRFIFTLDALTFAVGTYSVEVNVSKTGDGTIGVSTSFEVKSWDLTIKKKDVNSGFEYEYSAFGNKTVSLELYPTWRGNGSIIRDINTTTSINISLMDRMSNQLAVYNATWNASCGKEGCYEFSLTMPVNTGEFFISVAVSYNGETQTSRKGIVVIGTSLFAQSTDKEGSLKDLFGANDYAYISLSAKNDTASINLSDASIVSIAYMNGTEYSYTQVNDFNSVNSTNNNHEWSWNRTMQRFKFDTPNAGGVYTVYITAENNTAAASARFIVNPYDVCLVAKNTAGQVSGMSGYYYVYQFKTSDTIYFELKVTQATNPSGRASILNSSSNSSYGMGSACADQSSTKQAVNNATVSIEEVINMQSGKSFALNTTASSCQVDDNRGGYTCTIKPLVNWDGGSYGIKFKAMGANGQTDFAYGGFEARAFYLYAWSNNWQNKPAGNITMNVYMYEAGNNWWGSYGSGGLTGTAKLEKIEYQGSQGEWLSTPVDSGYNVSLVNTSTITNGQGSITFPANFSNGGRWKTGYYRAILKGTDSGGTSDYGYAWFSVRQWDVYASPVDCSGNSCTSTYNSYSKSNITLYVTISNAGEWGQSGNDLGGNIIISVKKMQDCRRWPCTDMNSSLFSFTTINVSKSSGWYWGSINNSYLINLTTLTGSWGTGYWQITLDVNGTETGSGWFNTIAFYAEAQPTDLTGNNWKYSIKNPEPIYFKVKTTKSQKSGYYYSSYNASDYLNTTIDDVVLKSWDQTTYQQIEYNYPENLNVSIIGGGSVINGTKIINITTNGSWSSGYYWGELTLRNSDNETATAWLWFQVKPFRVQMSSNQYLIDNTDCVNGTLSIYDPDWSSSTLLNGTYNFSSITENAWTGYGNSITTYTNFTPAGNFNATANFTICPDGGRWGSGSWNNYHYLTVKIQDSTGSSDNGWLSFKAVPFSVSWSSIVGGSNVLKTSNIVIPVNLSRPVSGASTSGNLSRIYQWRWDTRSSNREEYVFSIGICYSNVSGSCTVNGVQNVTVYAPSTEWKEGYNYLQTEWVESGNSSSMIRDESGIWFNGRSSYNGWFDNADANGSYKYNFVPTENLTIRLYVRNIQDYPTAANVTKVEYALGVTNCWDDYCRTYTNATYSIIGRADNELNNTGIIRIIKGSDWTRGTVYIKATVTGVNGTAVIKNGMLNIKDNTPPNLSVSTPLINATINSSTFWINLTTTEPATCSIYGYNYDIFYTWNCGSWNASNSTSNSIGLTDACNTTKYNNFNGSSYFILEVRRESYYWNTATLWAWVSVATGLSTGGTSHYYLLNTSIISMTNQHYGFKIWCYDEDYNTGYYYTAILLNVSNSTQTPVNVSLVSPFNGTYWNNNTVALNYSLSGQTSDCSLYGNFTGNWSLNITSNGVAPGSRTFGLSLPNGTYIWNVYCVAATNSSNYMWGNNWTFIVNVSNITQTQLNVTGSSDSLSTAEWRMFGRSLNHTRYYPASVNMTNFSMLWNYTAAFRINSSVAVVNGLVYIGGNDNTFYALNATTGGHAWNYSAGAGIYSSSAIVDGVVYFGSRDNKIYALNASTGSLIWNFTTGGKVDSSPAIASGVVYASSYDARVYSFNASTGAQIWNYTTGMNISSSPAVANGIVYVGSLDNKTYALNITTGSLIWNYTTNGSVMSSPAVASGIVYVGSWDNNTYALNATNGSLIWNYTTGGKVDSSPAVVNDIVYTGSNDNKLYALNATTGSLIWNYTTNGSVISSPAVSDGIVYFGSRDNKTYALNTTNGTLIWNYTTGNVIESSPAIANGVVYIGSSDNKIYAFKAL